MKIPKYIDEALKKRTKAAEAFTEHDWTVSEWLDKNGIADNLDSEDFHGGVESVVNPRNSERRIREAILSKE